jgi:hypothetical protein
MTNRFKKLKYGDGYVVRDSQPNGMPQIRLQYSDDAFLLAEFLNKQQTQIEKLQQQLYILKFTEDEYNDK